MHRTWLLILVVALAGCAAKGGDGTAAQDSDPWAKYRTCGGTFKDGAAVQCSQGADVVEPEPSVPLGWVPWDRAHSNNFDEWQPYVNPAQPAQMGVWFHAMPRTEGDFASPHPTQYGGLLRVGSGPTVAWQGPANEGFVRYPVDGALPARGPMLVTVYIPVVNDFTAEGMHANATLVPWWHPGADIENMHAVLVLSDRGTDYYFHDGLAGLGSAGYSLAKSDLFAFHIYLLLDALWRGP